MQKNENNLREPLVSMGLCVWNGAEYLGGAIDSLLAQTYKNFELIISDNASTDDTQKICEERARKDKRIRYIRQKENIGSFGNYDFVRRESRGDYFMYTSNDDLWDSRFIEKCLAKFEEAPDAMVVFPNFCTFDDSGRVMMYYPREYFPFARDLYARLKTYILSRGQYGKSTIIYGLWKKHTPTDPILLNEYRSDMIYVFRTLFTGYFASINEVLFFKRLPVQFPLDCAKKRPSLRFLTALPKDRKYESVDGWLETGRKINKSRSFTAAAKEFVADRIQAAKYSYLYSQCIFRSRALSQSEKIRLFLWNFYAYLRSLWYGHV